ncbi:MAG: hypothetical protein Q9220_004322 [cf. Caloplaca sp. 1 TL-2023]
MAAIRILRAYKADEKIAYLRNSTATASATPSLVTAPASNASCCFVVQDTIDARYWADYATTTWYGPRNVTSLVTSITQFVDTAVTNYHNTTFVANTSYLSSYDLASARIPVLNLASGRQTTAVTELNGTAVTTAATTIQSPQAFYLFSTVKVINVPAVTDKGGNKACATTSIDSVVCSFPEYTCPQPSTFSAPYATLYTVYSEKCYTASVSTSFLSSNLFPGINTYAEAYFETQDSASKTTAAPPISSYTVISFSTPFVYLPVRGAKEGIDNEAVVYLGDNYHDNTGLTKRALAPATDLVSPRDGAPEDFGYVPQALIDWMAKNPDYANQYPGLASCLPGGPSIKPIDNCGPSEAPATLAAVPDLTVNTAVTVQGEGCFHPGACPTPQADTSIKAEPAALPAGNTVQATSSPSPANNSPAAAIPLLADLQPSTSESPTGTSSVQNQEDTGPSAASPDTTAQPIPIIPPVVDQTMTSTTQPAVQIQPQSPAPQQPPQSPTNPPPQTTATTPISPQTSSTPPTIIDSTNSNPQPPNNQAAAPINPSPNIASLIMAGFGPPQPSPATPAPPFINNDDAKLTITPGAPAVIVSGTTYSAPTSASAAVIVVDGVTSTLPVSAGSGPVNTQPIIIGGGAANTYDSSPSTTTNVPLNDGSAITVSGTTYSLPPSSGTTTAVLVNGNPSPLPSQPLSPQQPALIISGTQTLLPGGAALTLSGGTVISLPPSQTSVIVVGGITESLVPPTQASASEGNNVVFTLGGGAVVTAGVVGVEASASASSTAGGLGQGESGGGSNGIGGGGAGSNATAGGGNGTNGYTGPAFSSGAAAVGESGRWWMLAVVGFAAVGGIRGGFAV